MLMLKQAPDVENLFGESKELFLIKRILCVPLLLMWVNLNPNMNKYSDAR